MTEDQQRVVKMLEDALVSIKGCSLRIPERVSLNPLKVALSRDVLLPVADEILARMTWKKAFKLPAEEEP